MSDVIQQLVPPFTRETAALKARKAEDNWNTRTLSMSRWDIPQTVCGVTVRNLSTAVMKSSASCCANGNVSWNTDSLKSSGRLMAIESRSGSPMSFAMTPASGIVRMAMKTGSSTRKESCIIVMRVLNDVRINESDRLFHWPLGRRPDDHPGLK